MDASSMSHHCRKILLDLQTASSTSPRSDVGDQDAPPSYQSSLTNDEALECDKDDSSEHTISIDASTYINGTSNIVNNDHGALCAKLTAALTTILSNSKELPATDLAGNDQSIPAFRIRLDCGVKILGHRNIVGPVRAQDRLAGQCNKRKFESAGDKSSEGPAAKKAI